MATHKYVEHEKEAKILSGKSLFGMKLFKHLEGGLSIIRVIGFENYKDSSKETDYNRLLIRDDGIDKTVTNIIDLNDLAGYTILEPDGLLTISGVTMRDEDNAITQDIIVTGTKYLNVKYLHDMKPYCICRQGAYDIYNSTATTDYYGVAINQDDCPSDVDMGRMLQCSNIWRSEVINFYRNDTLDDIFEFVDTSSYDMTLRHMFNQHMSAYKKSHTADTSVIMESFDDKPHHGWCKSLKLLLDSNSFQTDLNDMLGITQLDFELAPYITTKFLQPGNPDTEYYTLSEDVKLWLASMFKISINNTFVLEYDHDVNLAEFNDTRYFLLRDIKKKLYLVTFTVEGEYKEIELIAKANELDFSTKFRLAYHNKHAND